MAKTNIDSLLPTGQVDQKRVRRFLAQDASTQPPIEIATTDAGIYIVDGNHRFFASLLRGQEQVETIETQLSPTQKSRWLKRIGG